jgi:hypothetical protein
MQIDSALLHKAFGLCTRIIFPANVQEQLYAGLYKEGVAVRIYNGELVQSSVQCWRVYLIF